MVTPQTSQSCSSQEQRLQELKEAFEVFSSNTLKLQHSYQQLKQQFQQVNEKLQTSNLQLKEKVQQLKTTTHYLNTILDCTSQGIFFVDKEGIIQTMNPAAYKILGLARLQNCPVSFWDVFNDHFFGFSMNSVLKTKTLPPLHTISIPSDHYEEKILDVELCFTKEFSSSLLGVLVLFRDVTATHQLQRLKTRHDRLKELGEMAARVAHEIRNPLGGIGGFASLLARDLKEQPQLQKMAEFIVEGTKSLNQLVNCVLDYSRPLEMHFNNIDLLDIIDQCIEHMTADPAFAQCVIQTHLPIVPCFIWADALLIKSVLLNLLVNAQQAMAQGGTIVITASNQEHTTTLSIEDTGIGIPPHNLEKIFSPFFTTKTTGNGIGLAQVYKIIQAHGGSIEVTSEVNQGSLFTIVLPKIETATRKGNL